MRIRPSSAALVLAGLVAFTPPVAAAGARPFLDEARGVLTYAPLVAQATPAVVNISVSATAPGQPNPLMQDPFFRRFFGSQGGEQGTRQVQAAGSGVIIDAAKGYVVTNNHVVEGATKISVTTKDGRQLDGKLLGRDPDTDVALIQIDPNNLVALPMGDSSQLQVGDVVLAVGNPFGLGQTVTSGIVSALGRSGLDSEHYENFIQTDAPINPGNSGGALIDTRGALVGMNSAIIAPSGGNVGIGFAVPSSIIQAVVGQIERYGEVRRGRIGVQIATVTPGIAQALGLGEVRGAAVNRVERGSPAERAGLKTGDVILDIDGQPVQTSAQVRNGVGLKEVGSTVKLTVLRNGQQQTIDVKIEAVPQAQQSASAVGSVPQISGATLAAAGNGQNASVVVQDVQPQSRAWQLGLRAGDVIVGANRTPVHSIDELKSVAGKGAGSIALDVRRGDSEMLIFAG